MKQLTIAGLRILALFYFFAWAREFMLALANGQPLTSPRCRSQLLCNRFLALDGRAIRPEPPHSGGRIGRNEGLGRRWSIAER